MQVYAVFSGGVNYSTGSVYNAEDVEVFASLKSAGDTLWSRRAGRDSYYPNVDDTAQMSVYFADPRPTGQEYPDRVITVGPRGGIRVERA